VPPHVKQRTECVTQRSFCGVTRKSGPLDAPINPIEVGMGIGAYAIDPELFGHVRRPHLAVDRREPEE